MDCNRDEAMRAKSTAEIMLELKDYSGAKKFALKAQSLYPELEGISQMLTTIEVFISAESKVNGNIDWYRVLGVDPMAEENVIKKNYRKLALALHPDKNRLASAADAFKLVGEGWSMLSDTDQRLAYDLAMGVGGFGSLSETLFASGQNPSEFTGPSAHAGCPWTQADGSSGYGSAGHHSGPFAQTTYPHDQSRSPYAHERSGATQNEAPSNPLQESQFAKFMNREPEGPKASHPRPPKKRFSADWSHSKSSPSSSGPKVGTFWTICSNCETMFEYDIMYQNKLLFCIMCKKSFLAAQIPQPSRPGRPVHQNQPDQNTAAPMSEAENLEVGSDEPASQAAPPPPMPDHQNSRARQTDSTSDEPDPMVDFVGPSKATKDAQKTHGREELSMKLKQLSREGPTVKPKVATDESEGNMSPCKRAKKDHQPKDASDGKYSGAAMAVSDPDFYDFDRDRTEESFAENEVWAAYDDGDGMPRLYAMVHRVLSRSPFKLRMSWLNSKTTAEFGPLDWVGSGFPKTCGEFRIGKYEVCRFLNVFSHRMSWTRGPRGAVVILPKKGEAWALYRNWSAEWGPETPEEVVREYDMVSVVEDYELGGGWVTVVRLEKVRGFSTVFAPSTGESGLVRVRKEEMCRFSHQVPQHKLAAGEVAGAVDGWVELDPAAMPEELLRRVVDDGGEGQSRGEGSTEGGGA